LVPNVLASKLHVVFHAFKGLVGIVVVAGEEEQEHVGFVVVLVVLAVEVFEVGLELC
jgi:hypothetical protein